MRRRSVCAILSAVASAACGPAGHREPPDYSGVYRVTASPTAQSCGSSTVTFTATFVFVVVDGTLMASAWDWTGVEVLEPAYGEVSGDSFQQSWTSTRTDTILCPATGAGQVVTTYVNAWTGTFGYGTFDSVLQQTLDDDCGVVNDCPLTWNVQGTRSG